MRAAIFGLLAATMAVCTGCGPAPGSKEWCDKLMESIKDVPTAEQQEGVTKCVASALSGAFGQ